MSRFFPPGEFHGSETPLQLMPLRFERTDSNEYLVSNMVGDFIRFSAAEFQRLIELQVKPGDGLYERAYSAHLVSRECAFESPCSESYVDMRMPVARPRASRFGRRIVQYRHYRDGVRIIQ